VKSKDINNVKEKLLQDLCDKKLCKDDDVDKYLDQIKQCMISKKNLVVVDDVDMKKNLGALQLCINKHATNVNYKSKIFINYRNWQILKIYVREFTKIHGILGG
jgi:ribosomal protein S18